MNTIDDAIFKYGELLVESDRLLSDCRRDLVEGPLTWANADKVKALRASIKQLEDNMYICVCPASVSRLKNLRLEFTRCLIG